MGQVGSQSNLLETHCLSRMNETEQLPNICNMALADAMLPSINTFSSNQILDQKQSEIVRVSSTLHLQLFKVDYILKSILSVFIHFVVYFTFK